MSILLNPKVAVPTSAVATTAAAYGMWPETVGPVVNGALDLGGKALGAVGSYLPEYATVTSGLGKVGTALSEGRSRLLSAETLTSIGTGIVGAVTTPLGLGVLGTAAAVGGAYYYRAEIGRGVQNLLGYFQRAPAAAPVAPPVIRDLLEADVNPALADGALAAPVAGLPGAAAAAGQRAANFIPLVNTAGRAAIAGKAASVVAAAAAIAAGNAAGSPAHVKAVRDAARSAAANAAIAAGATPDKAAVAGAAAATAAEHAALAVPAAPNVIAAHVGAVVAALVAPADAGNAAGEAALAAALAAGATTAVATAARDAAIPAGTAAANNIVPFVPLTPAFVTAALTAGTDAAIAPNPFIAAGLAAYASAAGNNVNAASRAAVAGRAAANAAIAAGNLANDPIVINAARDAARAAATITRGATAATIAAAADIAAAAAVASATASAAAAALTPAVRIAAISAAAGAAARKAAQANPTIAAREAVLAAALAAGATEPDARAAAIKVADVVDVATPVKPLTPGYAVAALGAGAEVASAGPLAAGFAAEAEAARINIDSVGRAALAGRAAALAATANAPTFARDAARAAAIAAGAAATADVAAAAAEASATAAALVDATHITIAAAAGNAAALASPPANAAEAARAAAFAAAIAAGAGNADANVAAEAAAVAAAAVPAPAAAAPAAPTSLTDRALALLPSKNEAIISVVMGLIGAGTGATALGIAAKGVAWAVGTHAAGRYVQHKWPNFLKSTVPTPAAGPAGPAAAPVRLTDVQFEAGLGVHNSAKVKELDETLKKPVDVPKIPAEISVVALDRVGNVGAVLHSFANEPFFMTQLPKAIAGRLSETALFGDKGIHDVNAKNLTLSRAKQDALKTVGQILREPAPLTVARCENLRQSLSTLVENGLPDTFLTPEKRENILELTALLELNKFVHDHGASSTDIKRLYDVIRQLNPVLPAEAGLCDPFAVALNFSLLLEPTVIKGDHRRAELIGDPDLMRQECAVQYVLAGEPNLAFGKAPELVIERLKPTDKVESLTLRRMIKTTAAETGGRTPYELGSAVNWDLVARPDHATANIRKIGTISDDYYHCDSLGVAGHQSQIDKPEKDKGAIRPKNVGQSYLMVYRKAEKTIKEKMGW